MIKSQRFHQVLVKVLRMGNYHYFNLQNYQWDSTENRIKHLNNNAGYTVIFVYFVAFTAQLQKSFEDLHWKAVHGYLSCMLIFVASVNILHVQNRQTFDNFIHGLMDFEKDIMIGNLFD